MALPEWDYASVWIVLVKVEARSGETVAPIALSARNLSTEQMIELGVPKLLGIKRPPYPTGATVLSFLRRKTHKA